jgi:4-hydroxy-tetrahydrodipicolinate synthase
MFQGSTVALVTPHKNGEIDKDALADLVEFQIENGTNALLPCGCTGEAATMSHDEQIETIRFVVEQAKGRVPIMAGSGSNNTKEALQLTQRAKAAGADGALLITPYYNKPTQGGLIAHYNAIAEAVNIPIILYNVPGRTSLKIEPETIAELSKTSNIIAVKEACGSVDQVSQILALCDIMVLSGDDTLTLPMMSVGAQGIVSVVANLVPQDVSALVSAFNAGNLKLAQELHYKMVPLNKAMFIETNPLPVKTALSLMGKIQNEFRLPLVLMQEDTKAQLERVLQSYEGVAV